MQRAYTIERNELVIEQYNSGKTVLEIAESLNISESAIKNILRNAGITVKKKSTLLGEAITGMLMNGMSTTEICDELGCAKPTVTYYKKLLGVPLGYPRAVTQEEIEIMKDLRYKKGLCNKEIAERMNRNLVTVLRHIGTQDEQVTEFYRTAAKEATRAYGVARIKTKRHYEQRAKAEAARLEAERLERERLERERIEKLRLAKENEIKEMLVSLGVSADSFTIESTEAGNAFLNNLITRATEKLSVGA